MEQNKPKPEMNSQRLQVILVPNFSALDVLRENKTQYLVVALKEQILVWGRGRRLFFFFYLFKCITFFCKYFTNYLHFIDKDFFFF